MSDAGDIPAADAQHQREQMELRNVLRHAHTIITHSTVVAPEGWDDPQTTWGVERYDWDLQVDDLEAALEAVPLAIAPGQSFASAWGRAKHPDERAAMDATATRALRSGAPSYHQDFRLTDKYGHVHWFDQVTAIEPTGPGRWRVTAINNDITARKTAETELAAARISAEQAKAAAEVASRAKDYFLAVLSHELRTPLAPVLATAQMLEEDQSLSAENHEMVELIQRNVELEARLIDDLLDLTRISQGKLELHLANVDVHKKISNVVSLCADEIVAKQLTVKTELSATGHDVRADPARFQQIVWNLLKNAVKFTPVSGQIIVRTSNPAEGRISIEVIDNGIGIAPDMLQRIFHAFDQGDRQITRQFGGLGLGLAISKVLVESHGGRITVASNGPGSGATFTVELPLGAKVSSPESHRAARPNRKVGGTVLLVEDHADTRQTMTLLLQRIGCRVASAGTLTEAIKLADEKHFDLLISDIGLPDGTGLDLMRHVKAHHGLRGIALSGYGMEDDVALSRAAGFEAHLIKPVNVQALEETVRQLSTPAWTTGEF